MFLATNGVVTGVTLPVDGGLSIASPAAFLRPDFQERWLDLQDRWKGDAVTGLADGGPRLDVVGFGEAMVLVVPSGPLAAATEAGLHVAGAELNVCAAVAALGATSAFATRVGADPFGARIIADVARLGVRTDLIDVDDRHPTGVFFKDVHPDGARRVYYYRSGSAAAHLSEADADRVLAARPRLVVVSGITAALGPAAEAAVTRLITGARDAGVRVALDPNLRPAMGSVAAQAQRLLPLLRHVDVLLLGLDEAPWLFGAEDPASVLAAAADCGAGTAVVKAGADGAYVLVDGDVTHVPTAATVVVDPVGAGDAFAGGYLYGYLGGRDAYASARLGSALAARVVATVGDNDGLPRPDEVAGLLA